MIVSTSDGRHRSVLTRKERFQKVMKRWKALSAEERRAVQRLLDEFYELSEEADLGFEDLGEVLQMSKVYGELTDNHYRGQLVGIDEFVKDNFYLGITGRNLYPKWLADLKEFFSSDYNEAIISGSIGGGKSTWAEIALIRIFYELTMLRDPQSTFGLMDGDEILLVCYNRDDRLARKVTYGGIKVKLEQSPYFKSIGCKIGPNETIFPKKNISIVPVSARSATALGRNVFGGIIDEADFLSGSSISGKERAIGADEKPFAELLHESVIRRMKSRYDRAGILPGRLILASSARHKESFTNRRMAEATTDPSVFCRDYAIYDVKPAHHFSKERFWVLVGTERIRHKILKPGEYEELGDDGRKKLIAQGCKFINPPISFKSDFERNIEDSVRDIGGIVTVGVSPFIQMRDRIYHAIDSTLEHPVETETWMTNEPCPFVWSKLAKQTERRLVFGQKETFVEPLRHPDAVRHAHIDLSLGKQDAAGLCIAHQVDTIEVERRSQKGKKYIESAPLIEVDLLLRIVAPPNEEIDVGAVRGLIYEFMDYGYTFGFISMDSFNSAESLQKFRQQGIPSELVSVDTKFEPYDTLKAALNERRVHYYKYPWLIKELEDLQRDQIKGQIVHLPNGSKDCADALAGVVFSLTTKLKHRAPIALGISQSPGIQKDDEWIRQTLDHSGDKAPKQVDLDKEGPLVFKG